jgi:hypothetical protein
MNPEATLHRVSAIFLAILATMMVWQFHDQNWWGPDDGAYAHIAERLLKGEVLNGSIYDIHLGLVHFIHAATFKLFGTSIVGLRYPLALMTVVQSLIVLWLFRDRDWLTALAGGMAMAVLTFVQFLNPSANWYALFATVFLIAATVWIPREAAFRYCILGGLLMIVIMFRQLTGGLVAIGLVTYLLCEDNSRSTYRGPILGRVVLALCGLLLGFYLFKTASPLSILLFGIWPVALIFTGWVNCVMSDRAAIRMLAQLTFGATVAIAPLLLYHFYHGSLLTWFDDTVFSAFRLVSLPFMDKASYAALPLVGMMSATDIDANTVINEIFWVLLLLAPVVLGIITVSRSLTANGSAPLLAHMAVFFAVVSAHYEIPIYLFFSTAMTLCGLLALTDGWNIRVQGSVAVCVLLLAGVGLWSHAGQPVTRGLAGVATGARAEIDNRAMEFRVGLRVAPTDRAFYEWLVPLIMQNSGPEDSILALPVNPELYFMTGRRNPTRFFNSALGLRSDAEVEALLSTLEADPPALVVFRTDDKYVTPNTVKVVTKVRETYRRIALRDGIEVYTRSR